MTTLYVGTKPLVLKDKHDPDEAAYYSIGWRPAEWAAGTEYLLDELVVPITPNGYCYVCINPGVTAAAEPVWASTPGTSVEDGTVIWEARAYDLMLRAGDSMISSWITDTDVVTDNPGTDGNINWIRVTAVPATASSFTLTNRASITRADGKQEVLDRKIIIPILR